MNPILSFSHRSNKKGLVDENALTIVLTNLSRESFVNVFFQFIFFNFGNHRFLRNAHCDFEYFGKKVKQVISSH